MKRKILIFIDWYLPGFLAGGPTRSCANMIAHLRSEFDFFIVTSNRDYLSQDVYSDIPFDRWTSAPDGTPCYYHSGGSLSNALLESIFQKVKPDFVYLNSMFSRHYTLEPLRYSSKEGIATILAPRGMLAPGALSIKPWKKKIFLIWSKWSGLFDKVTFQASSETESDQILKHFPKAPIRIASNLPRKNEKIQSRYRSEGPLRIVNVARIAPEKNLLFALEVLQKLKLPVQFDVYGPVYDNEYWEKCQVLIGQMPVHVKVNHKGVAEEDQLFRILKGYDLLFLPTLGENFGHIILEAMSAGLPVLISDNTPWQGLESVKAGWDISLGQKETFSRIIDELAVMPAPAYREWSEGAARKAKEFMSDKGWLQANRLLFS